MTETPPPDRKMPLPEMLSVFLLTCGALILLYAGYLWIGANMAVSDLREQEKELNRPAIEEVQNDAEAREAAIAAAKEEQEAIREEIKNLHEELVEMEYDDNSLIHEEIDELNERLVALQQEINEERSAARDAPPSRRRAVGDAFEVPFELQEKISLSKTLALISLFFIVPGLLLRVPALLKGA